MHDPRGAIAMILPAPPSDDAPHLLVVDDDRRIRDLLSRFLTGEGYRVTTAETAADARAKLYGLSFDLLILDVMMPGESGFEFVKSLRGSSNVPILMLTAGDAAESRIKGLEVGADDYLAKPFEPRELSLRIAAILKRAQPAAAPPVEPVRFWPLVYALRRGGCAAARAGVAAGGPYMSSIDISHGFRTAVTRLREFWEYYGAIPPIRNIYNGLGQMRGGGRRMSRC